MKELLNYVAAWRFEISRATSVADLCAIRENIRTEPADHLTSAEQEALLAEIAAKIETITKAKLMKGRW